MAGARTQTHHRLLNRHLVITTTLLVLVLTIHSAQAEPRPNRRTCSYGLSPGPPLSFLIPARARSAVSGAIDMARKLDREVASDISIRAVARNIASLLLLANPKFSDVPSWRILALTGDLVPLSGNAIIGRRNGIVTMLFPQGARLRLDIRAIRFSGNVSRIEVAFVKGKPRVLLQMSRPIDVSRMMMSDETDCATVELKLDEP